MICNKQRDVLGRFFLLSFVTTHLDWHLFQNFFHSLVVVVGDAVPVEPPFHLRDENFQGALGNAVLEEKLAQPTVLGRLKGM